MQQGVEQFLAKYSRLLLLEDLQYHGLISEGSGVAGVGRKSGDAVANEAVDVANSLGCDIVGWLVVGRLEGGGDITAKSM